jgi:hypothetical protein
LWVGRGVGVWLLYVKSSFKDMILYMMKNMMESAVRSNLSEKYIFTAEISP